MGSFYTNVTLRTASQTDVVAALKAEHRDAFVSSADNGCVVVYDRESEEQEPDVLKKLAGALSAKLKCAALAITNHDDDVLLYTLHEGGKLLDEYNSSPGYFESGPGDPPKGGDAKRLCKAFGTANVSGVEAVLRTKNAAGSDDDEGYVFESERHVALAEALGAPTIAVQAGFNYIEEGELPDGTDESSFVRV